MGQLNAIKTEWPNVVIIEDCAESLFSSRRLVPCGRLADIATWSFQATKTITCGEGGAVAFKDPEQTARAKLIRSHGMTGEKKYWHYLVGHNFRLTNIQAAVLCAQLGHRAEIEEMRARVYGAYVARLHAVPGIALQRIPDAVKPVMWALGVLLPAGSPRDKLMQELATDGIETRPGFYSAAQQPLYDCPPRPVADDIAARLICLPMSADLDEADLHYVCDRFIARLASV
jgi:perosamine synthetase